MSDGLSRAKDAVGKTWSGISSAVSTHWSVGKLQRQIADLVAERDRLMMEIGHKVYALYGREKVKNADLLDLCRRIEETGRTIDRRNAEIRALAEPPPEGKLEEAELEDETTVEEVEPAPEEPAAPAPEEPPAPAGNNAPQGE